MCDDIEQLIEEKVAEAVAERDERINELEEKVAEQAERIEELEDRTPIEDVQKRVSILEGKVDTSEQAAPEPEAVDEAAPPIYTLLQTPEPNLQATERRTRFLWKDLGDYARKAPVGLVLSASDAKRVLNAAEPEESDAGRITSKQVGRVFHLMKDLTRDVAEIHEKDGQRQLVVPDGWENRARDAAPDTAVS